MSVLLNDMLSAAIAGFGFAYACNPLLETLIFSALLAAIAHGLRFALLNYFHSQTLAIATFMASSCIGCLGILCTKISKASAGIITFPALIPMIPGVYVCQAILYLFSFVRSEGLQAKINFLIGFFNHFFTVLSVTLALAVGVSVTLLIFFEQSFVMTRNRKELKRII